MKFLKTLGFTMILIALAFLLVAALFWGLSIGTVKLPLDQIYNSVLEQLTGDLPIEAVGRGPVHDIVWLLRLPRLVLAALIGCGLAVCGVIMQAIVKNPLADPYILGISSGALLEPPLPSFWGSERLWDRTSWESVHLSGLLSCLWQSSSYPTLGDGQTP